MNIPVQNINKEDIALYGLYGTIVDIDEEDTTLPLAIEYTTNSGDIIPAIWSNWDDVRKISEEEQLKLLLKE